MTERLSVWARKSMPWFSAGILLQTGGCVVEGDALLQGLVTAIANNLITSIVFGVFNIPLSGF